MSLAKIPIICLVAWGFQRCITSPNPPPAREELAKQSSIFDASWYIQTTPGPAISLQWIVSIIEILTIIDYHLTALSISPNLYPIFWFREEGVSRLVLSSGTVIGAILVFAGTYVRITTYRYLGTFFRYEASIQKDHKLVTGGPYSIVRHPGYTGLLLSYSGWFFWHLAPGSWVRESGFWDTTFGKICVLGFAVYVLAASLYMTLSRMGCEDAALRARFGDSWDRWAEKVSYSVIPGIY